MSPRRVSRRVFVAGGAVTAAVAAGVPAVLLLREGSAGGGQAGPGPPPASTTTPGLSPTPTPAVATGIRRPQGGTARLAAAGLFSADAFDALRSGEPSIVEVLGRTHSRLVQWASFGEARLGADLAEAWEQPDRMTLVLRLDPNARWQPRPPLDGRPMTAGDVAAHLRRAAELARGNEPASTVWRPWEYRGIRRVTAPDPTQVVIEIDRPDPFLLNTLAGRLALVQAQEVVERVGAASARADPSLVVGSGPFVFDGPAPAGGLRFGAHRAGHRQPALDGVVVSQPALDADSFRAKRLDAYIARDRRQTEALRAELGTTVRETAHVEPSPVVTTLFAGAPPWNNADLRRALSGALNRRALVTRLFGGRGLAATPAMPPVPAFALTEAELSRFPGYRADPAEDAKEARALWEKGGGQRLGPLTVDFPNIFDPLYGASGVVPPMLREALGIEVRPAVEAYPAISERAANRSYGSGKTAIWFGWAPPFFEPEPSRALIETFHSRGPDAHTYGFQSERVNRLLDRMGREFDRQERARLCREATLAILEEGFGGLIPWVVQLSETFSWPYLERAPFTPFWDQHHDAEAALDVTHPSFAGRPA